MKKIATLLVTIVMIFALVACQNKNDTSGKITVVIDGETDAVYTVSLDKVEITEGMYSVLVYLKENENLEFKTNGTGAMIFLESIGSLNPDASKNEFIAIYTTVAADDEETYGSMEYDGKTIYSSGVGLSGMTILDGATIAFKISSY